MYGDTGTGDGGKSASIISTCQDLLWSIRILVVQTVPVQPV